MSLTWLREQLTSRLSRNDVDSLAVVGAVIGLYVIVRLTMFVWTNFKVFVLSPTFNLAVDLKTLGQWAVVTGASDGIGKAFAIQLARRGLNVVLISRTKDKLDAVVALIESESKVKTKCIVVDFAHGFHIYERISAELAGLDVAILVNNVGTVTSEPDYLCNLDDKEVFDMIVVNCGTMTHMTKMLLPDMVAKRKGVIINVSSLYGTVTGPILSIYSATKAYADYFSRAVEAEYRHSGVIIQTAIPSTVATGMVKLTPNVFIPSPMDYADSLLNTVGLLSRTNGHWKHIPTQVVITLLPECLLLPVMFLYGRFFRWNVRRAGHRVQQHSMNASSANQQ